MNRQLHEDAMDKMTGAKKGILKSIFSRKGAYVAGVAVPTALAGGLGIYSHIQSNRYVDSQAEVDAAQAKADAAQVIADSGFNAERQNLRSKSLADLRDNPSMDTRNGLMCEYAAALTGLADEYNQDGYTDEKMDADITAFGDMLRDELVNISLPLAQRRIEDSKDKFGRYVEKSAKRAAIAAMNPDDSPAVKARTIRFIYQDIQDYAAANYQDEGVEVLNFGDFFDMVGIWHNDFVVDRNQARRNAIAQDDQLTKFLEAELDADMGYASEACSLSDIFLEMYRQNIAESIMQQTEGIMSETESQRRSSLESLSTTLEQAEKSSTDVLRNDCID